MNKLMLNLFKFIKNLIQFMKIITIFSILIFILYWVQNLIGSSWCWIGFMTPLLELYADVGYYISSTSITIFNATLEYKYLIALLLFIVTYGIMHLFYLGVCFLEDLYDSGRKILKNIEQNLMNKSFEKEILAEEKQIKYFMLYFETSLKERGIYNTSLEEQNKTLIKYLVEKFGACPEKFEGGFIYKYLSFEQVDNYLEIFLKLPKSKAPLNYFTCLQIINTKSDDDSNKLKKLISLKIFNKVVALAETKYRYGFNTHKKFNVCSLGIYQKEGSTFEVFEFLDNN